MLMLRRTLLLVILFFCFSQVQAYAVSWEVPYKDALNVANQLKQKQTVLDKAINQGNLELVDFLYDDLSATIRKTERAIGKVPRSSKRDYLLKEFVRPAKITKERVIYEVSQLRLLNQIDAYLKKGNTTEAKNLMAKLDRLKRRAIKIKETGGYSSLPAAINNYLINYESTLSTQIETGSTPSLYSAIYNGISSIKPEINVGSFSKDSNVVFETLNSVLQDHPELFYFSYKGSLFWSDGKFEIKYLYPTSTILSMKSQLEQKANQIISKTITPGMSEYQKVKAIHDYLVLNTAYDYDNYLRGSLPEDSYNVYGALIKGTAVCEGYTEAMIYLLSKLNIETLYVTGTGNGEAHAWNKVKIDGAWYNVDATWNDPVPDKKGYVRYDYFLVTDSELAKDHNWDNSGFPKATDGKYMK
ncbi:transglutaminase domain-containing protein [Metabacillus litoralis]|uniref:transglutaminase domain-containing protein n=1 Tax=Metabacillus litoralis TaxID=152268 RepID=UPI0020403978|nr:transglutaminase domain-containing protein [Metabacillus litoralis]MCM3162593.1 hypothetical protein [Metabacillus litoralis]